MVRASVLVASVMYLLTLFLLFGVDLSRRPQVLCVSSADDEGDEENTR